MNIGKCHQRIIRERESEPAPNVLLDRTNATIRQVTANEAQKIILRYEWLGTMPACYRSGVGLFFGEHLAGVECFTDTKAGGKHTLNKLPAVCLARGACVSWAPSWASSFLIRKSLAFLDCRYQFVVCYSDTEAGEVGTVYQAANFVCLGEITNSYWLSPDGRHYDRCQHRNLARKLNKVYQDGKRIVKVNPDDAARVKHELEGKGWKLIPKGAVRYKYAEALGTGRAYRERRKYLESIAVPFPKREKNQ